MCAHQWLRKISKYLIYKIVTGWVACKQGLSKFLRASYLLYIYIHWPLKYFSASASQELQYCKTVWFTSVNRMMYNLVTSFIFIINLCFQWLFSKVGPHGLNCGLFGLLFLFITSLCALSLFSIWRNKHLFCIQCCKTFFIFITKAEINCIPNSMVCTLVLVHLRGKTINERLSNSSIDIGNSHLHLPNILDWTVQRKFQLWEIKHLFCI